MENTRRQIKFRAWDPDKGEYFPVSSISFKDGICWAADAHGDNRLEFELVRPSSLLEQFTGLLDKNGKEIYEGDIVEDVAGDPKWSGGQISSVSFDDEAQGFRAHRVLDRGMTGSPRLLGDWCEVIGNVHETPDLIEPGTNQKEA